jgi:hypothetical protein
MQIDSMPEVLNQAGPIEYISNIAVQVATIKTIRHQLESALDVKVNYSTLVEMQEEKIKAMTMHVENALGMLPLS